MFTAFEYMFIDLELMFTARKHKYIILQRNIPFPVYKKDYLNVVVLKNFFLLIADFMLLSMHNTLLFRGYKKWGCMV